VDNSSQAKSIELLQTTIEQLQTILEQIESASGENLPNLGDLEKLRNSSQAIAKKLTSSPPLVNQPLIIEGNLSESPTVSQPQPQLKQRSWIPILLGSIVAITIVFVIISVLKFTSPELPIETTEIVETPSQEITTPVEVKPIFIPKPPKPVVIPTTPVPQLQTIPEQGLIAAIQTEVDEITAQYSENLIKSIQADFLGGILIIELGDDWYQLTKIQQQEMANQILRRSQGLDFRKLEIRDTQGVVLGRNPVVGNNMVINFD